MRRGGRRHPSRTLRPGWLLLACGATGAGARLANVSRAQLRADRLHAEALWRSGQGFLWFQHFRRAGGTSLCHLLRAALPNARFLIARGEACQPEEWKLRDAAAVCEHNLTLLEMELLVQEGNAFAQEYGAVPGPLLLGHRVWRRRLHDWVFVTSMRDPWSRFWSQLRYEMATCLVNAKALALCIGGRFDLLGHYWSPTAHPDSVLGVPGAGLSSTPEIYVDNYYTRVLLNRTDMDGPKLTPADLEEALALLYERFSAVIVAEDFAGTALQLACSLGLDLGNATPLLRTRIRPYEAHEAMIKDVPADESELGLDDVITLRTHFVRKNRYDYALYAHARALARHRLSACSRRYPEVAALRALPPEVTYETTSTTTPQQMTVDDLFGCSGGSLELTESGEFFLRCPRTVVQHADSWWSALQLEGQPKRKLGQKLPGADCWQSGFSWPACCARHFGPEGNEKCWDKEFNYSRCCVAE